MDSFLIKNSFKYTHFYLLKLEKIDKFKIVAITQNEY